ncbi:unnamed protein product [Brassica oleracea]
MQSLPIWVLWLTIVDYCFQLITPAAIEAVKRKKDAARKRLCSIFLIEPTKQFSYLGLGVVLLEYGT